MFEWGYKRKSFCRTGNHNMTIYLNNFDILIHDQNHFNIERKWQYSIFDKIYDIPQTVKNIKISALCQMN